MVVSIREQTEVIQRKNEENGRLLLNILPAPIADRLKQGGRDNRRSFPRSNGTVCRHRGLHNYEQQHAPQRPRDNA